LIALTDQIDAVSDLYATLSARLERIVRLDVRAPDAVIEDACQFAWIRLIHHRQRVRSDAALSWLAKTAVHEAFKLIRREQRELSLDALLETTNTVLPAPGPSPQELVEQLELLDSVALLPERQRRFLWLHAVGLSYTEMAAHEDCTRRTVERQLLRAKTAVRAGITD
jgi:RNA polymerase sigma factor (sigma-70 family)